MMPQCLAFCRDDFFFILFILAVFMNPVPGGVSCFFGAFTARGGRLSFMNVLTLAMFSSFSSCFLCWVAY